jgi:hypothetical protein
MIRDFLHLIRAIIAATSLWIRTGSMFACCDTYIFRLSRCMGCGKYDKETKKCTLCHCFVSAKTRLRAESCPDQPPKWNKDL